MQTNPFEFTDEDASTVQKRKYATTKTEANNDSKRRKTETGAVATSDGEPMLDEVKKLLDEMKELQRELQTLREEAAAQPPNKGEESTLPDSDDGAVGEKKNQAPKRRRRAMTAQQKERLRVRICTLSATQLQGLISLLTREAPHALKSVVAEDGEEDLEIDISGLPSATLWMLDDYCKRS